MDVILEMDPSETSPGSRTCSHREASREQSCLRHFFSCIGGAGVDGGSVQSTGTRRPTVHLYLHFIETILDLWGNWGELTC